MTNLIKFLGYEPETFRIQLITDIVTGGLLGVFFALMLFWS